MDPVLVVAAVVPIAVGLTDAGRGHPLVWLDVLSWLAFVADYVVHLRLRPGYARSKGGIFDLVVVVVTLPWYLVTGIGAGRYMGIARLARLGRVFIVSTHSKKMQDLGRRLGQAAVYSGVLMLVCALVVRAAEPSSSGFDDIGDALWWSLVTFTTVGYGDLYPTTPAGRFAAGFLMVGGVALIGSLAASLGSFFNTKERVVADPDGIEDDGAEVEVEEYVDPIDEVLAEVRALRAEVAELRAALPPAPPPASQQ